MLIKAVSRLKQSSLCIFPPYKRLLMHPFSSLKNKKWSQIKWSKSAQQAVFSTSIIKLIRQSEPPQKIDDESLREKIINFKYQEGQFKLDEDVRNKVLQMFTTGIALDKNIFRQTRMNMGEQIKPTLGLKKFIFCPNYLVTRQIFDVFIRDHNGKKYVYLLITGNYGIAKTISILLLIHLSNPIHKFIFQTKQYSQLSESFKAQLANLADQLELLRQKQLIMKDIPKIFYWSIQMQNLIFNSREFILQQLPQINLKQRKTLKRFINNPLKFELQLNKIYPKDIPRILLVDQINAVASAARMYNEDAKRYNYDVNKIPQQTTKLRQNVFKAVTQINNLHAFADRVILNSSANIQEELLQGSKSLKTIGLKFHGHNKIQIVKLPFQQKLKQQKWAKIDFWHYFWFEITRNFIQDKEVDQKLRQIQKDSIFLKKIQSSFNIKSYFRFLYIRQHLDQKNELLFEINKNKSLQKIKSIIEEIVERFEYHCKIRHGEQLGKFMKKGLQKQKVAYMLSFYQSALKQKKQGLDNFTISSSKFYEFISLQENKIGENMIKVGENLFNKQFFTFQQANGKIIFTLTPVDFIEITTWILFPKLKDYFDKAVLGMVFETYFIQNLTKDTEIVMNFANYAEDQSKKKSKIIKWKKSQESTPITFTIANQEQLPFLPLNANMPYNNSNNQFIGSFQRNFKVLFDACKKSQNKYFAAVPKLQDGTRVTNSAYANFIIAKFDGEHLMLYTFDTTISKQKEQSNLTEKENDVKQLLRKFKKEDDKFIVQHTILAPMEPKNIRKEIFKPSDKNWLTITYSNWKNLKLTNKHDSISEGLFKSLVKFLQIEEQEYLPTLKKNNQQLNDEIKQASTQSDE